MEKDEANWQLALQHLSELKTERADLRRRIFTYLTTIAPQSEAQECLGSERIDPVLLGNENFEALSRYNTYKAGNEGGNFINFCDTLPGREGAKLKQLLKCRKEPPENTEDFKEILNQLYTTHTNLTYIERGIEVIERAALSDADFSPADAEKFAEPFKVAKPMERMDAAAISQIGAAILTQYQGFARLYIPSGFKIFDAHVHGYRRGGITTIAGRPGSGKTLWGTTSCAYQLMNTTARILFISTEMSDNDIMERIILAVANMEPGPVKKDGQGSVIADKNGRPVREWREDIVPKQVPMMLSTAEAFQKYSKRWNDAVIEFCHYVSDENKNRFHLYAADAITIEDIEKQVMALQARTPVDVVFVDYWQNIKGGEGLQEWERLQDIAQRLALIAKKFNLAIVCLAQLRRAQSGDDGKNSHPNTDDIRGSDQLAQLSVVVTCLSSYTASLDGLAARFHAADIVKARHGTQALIQQKLAGELSLIYEDREIEDWPKKLTEKKGTGLAIF